MKVKNPCISVCKYNEDDICKGCKRSKRESVNWPNFSNEEKVEILKKVEERKGGNRIGGIEYTHDLYI